jgi:hypothetical protein
VQKVIINMTKIAELRIPISEISILSCPIKKGFYNVIYPQVISYQLPLGVNLENQGRYVHHCQYWDDEWE